MCIKKWLPFRHLGGNYVSLQRSIIPVYLALPDLKRASLGEKLRYLRKRRRLTIPALSKLTGVGHNTISFLERGVGKTDVAFIGKLMGYFETELRDVLPDEIDPFDQIVAPKDFATWLKNFRLRQGLRQVEIAKKLGVTRAAVCRYEKNVARPENTILVKFRKVFGLNGEFDQFLKKKEKA